MDTLLKLQTRKQRRVELIKQKIADLRRQELEFLIKANARKNDLELLNYVEGLEGKRVR